MGKKLFEPEHMIQLILDFIGRDMTYDILHQDDWAKYVFRSEKQIMKDLHTLKEISLRKQVLMLLIADSGVVEELQKRGITCEGSDCFEKVVSG